jgi:hypothetical protein
MKLSERLMLDLPVLCSNPNQMYIFYYATRVIEEEHLEQIYVQKFFKTRSKHAHSV